ncbi:MAG: transporter substrate-binding domain-containing protein [Pseudorhodobacter sp.]
MFKRFIGAIVGGTLAMATVAHAEGPRGAIGEALDRQELVLMNNLAAAPWQFRDANGNPAGFSVDLNRMIAARLEVDLRMTDAEWAGLIPGMLANKSDFIASSMSTTFKRAQQVLFTTQTWYETGVVAIVKPDAGIDDWTTLNDPGMRIAIKAGTNAVDVAKRFFKDAEIQTYPSDVDLYQALQADRVDAALNDKAIMNLVEQEYGFTTAPNPRELISSDTWAFAVRPGDDFTWQYLDFFLTKIKEGGEMDALLAYWVDGADWQKDFLEANDGVSQARLDLVEFIGISDYTPETDGKRMTLE